MTLLPKKYFVEVFHYCSDQPSEAFKRELSEYFDTQWQTNRANMAGRFVKEDEFELTRKLEVGSSNTAYGGRTMMYVYGKITDQEGRTAITLSVTNPKAPYAIGGPLVLGVFFLWRSVLVSNIIEFFGGLFSIFGLPVILLRAGYDSKTRLKATFVNFFGLTSD